MNNINGVILLPDDWNSGYYNLNSTNNADAYYSTNTISSSQWTTLEQHGAVFLPAAGYRNGTSVNSVGSNGNYWSSSYVNRFTVWSVSFSGSSLGTDIDSNRNNGHSVRLVLSLQ